MIWRRSYDIPPPAVTTDSEYYPGNDRRYADIPMITLGTAHPVKFEEAVKRAGYELPKLPHHLTDLMEREERLVELPADLKTIHQFIADHTFKD